MYVVRAPRATFADMVLLECSSICISQQQLYHPQQHALCHLRRSSTGTRRLAQKRQCLREAPDRGTHRRQPHRPRHGRRSGSRGPDRAQVSAGGHATRAQLHLDTRAAQRLPERVGRHSAGDTHAEAAACADAPGAQHRHVPERCGDAGDCAVVARTRRGPGGAV